MDQYFRRIMDTNVKTAGDERVRVECVIKDKFYDFILETLITLPGDTIVQACGELKDATRPEICETPIRNLTKLAGVMIGPGFVRKAKDILGGDEECAVIIDALVESARMTKQIGNVPAELLEDLDVSDPLRVRSFELSVWPEFLNRCIPYQDGIEETFDSRGVVSVIRRDIYRPKPGQINRFRRDKIIEVHVLKDTIRLYEYMSDDIHEMAVELFLDRETRNVQEIRCKALRVPYRNLCDLPFQRVKELVGCQMGTDFKKQVHTTVGGSSGCIHLTDLILETTRYLDMVLNL